MENQSLNRCTPPQKACTGSVGCASGPNQGLQSGAWANRQSTYGSMGPTKAEAAAPGPTICKAGASAGSACPSTSTKTVSPSEQPSHSVNVKTPLLVGNRIVYCFAFLPSNGHDGG